MSILLYKVMLYIWGMIVFVYVRWVYFLFIRKLIKILFYRIVKNSIDWFLGDCVLRLDRVDNYFDKFNRIRGGNVFGKN